MPENPFQRTDTSFQPPPLNPQETPPRKKGIQALGIQWLVISGLLLALLVVIGSGLLLFRNVDSTDLLQQGKNQISQGKVAWARDTLKTLVEQEPNSIEGHLWLGKAYLELGDIHKAQAQFNLAQLLEQDIAPSKKGQVKSPQVTIAQSQLLIAQKDFQKAEAQLKALLKDSGTRVYPVEIALSDLYEAWGDADLKKNDAKAALKGIERYQKAIDLAVDDKRIQVVASKLERSVRYLLGDSSTLSKKQQIQLLEASVKHRQNPQQMAQLAALLDEDEQIDQALTWYRKSFQQVPDAVGFEYSKLLLKKGRLLLEQGKQQEAQTFFDKADSIGAKVHLGAEQLTPVRVTAVVLLNHPDRDQTQFTPRFQVKLNSQAERPVKGLKLRLVVESGDRAIQTLYRTGLKALAPQGMATSSQSLTLNGKPLKLEDPQRQQAQRTSVFSVWR